MNHVPGLPFLRKNVAPIIIWRLLILTVMAAAASVFAHNMANELPFVQELTKYSGDLLRSTANWDGIWYNRIIHEGYGTTPGLLPTVAFFPLYPLLVKAVMYLGLSAATASFVLNLLLTIGATYFLSEIVKKHLPEGKQDWPVYLWLSFPMAFFMGAMYTEALFCFLTFGAFYAHQKGKLGYVLAAVALLSATRVPGMLVSLAIAGEHLFKKDSKKAGLVLLATPLGLLAFMAYLKFKVGDALAFVHIHDTFFTQEKLNFKVWESLQYWWALFAEAWKAHAYAAIVRHSLPFIGLIGGGFLTIKGAIGKHKLPISMTLLCALSLGLFVLLDARNSFFRYLLPLFPLFITLARMQSREVYKAWIIGGAILMGYFAVLFATFNVIN